MWTVRDGGVLQSTGALLRVLPGGQWTPGDPPSSLHRSGLRLLAAMLPVVVEGSKIEPGQTRDQNQPKEMSQN